MTGSLTGRPAAGATGCLPGWRDRDRFPLRDRQVAPLRRSPGRSGPGDTHHSHRDRQDPARAGCTLECRRVSALSLSYRHITSGPGLKPGDLSPFQVESSSSLSPRLRRRMHSPLARSQQATRGASSSYGVPEPRPAIVADDAGTTGATEPESSSPSRISAVASAPDGAATAKWAPTGPLLSDGPSP